MQVTPAREHVWQTLRLLLACALAEGIGLMLGLRETYWALITTLVVTHPMQSNAREKGFDRTLASIIGGLVGLGVLELERFGWPKLPLFCIAFVPLAFLAAIRPNLRLAAITLIVVVLVPSSQDPLVRPFDRVLEIFIGSLAGWVVSLMFDSDRLRRVMPGRFAPEKDKG